MNILYIGEVLFFFLNLALADYHAGQFDAGKTINHFFWAICTGIAIGVFTYVSKWNWWFCGALVFERLWCFNPMLNFLRKPKKPFFYTHSDKVGGSWMDSVIGNAYPFIFGASLIGFITFQWFI